MRKSATLIMTILCSLLCAAAWAQDTHWTCNPHDYQYDMTVYFGLTVDGEAVTDYSDYEVAAFVGDECRGVGEQQTAGTATYGYLRVRSNQASGENVTFKVYVKSTNMEVDVKDYSISFASQAVQGMPSSPVVLDFVPYIPGDADGDGSVSITDISIINDVILMKPGASVVLQVGDLDGDGEISITDISMVNDIILKKN